MDWTFDAAEVQWMTERLTHFWDRRLVAIAPIGFPAYGRVFHPAYAEDGTPVRWATVAAHHGLSMTATSAFDQLLLPHHLPRGRDAWRGNPPHLGTLDTPQAERLIQILRCYTKTPDAITFALWDGLGWDGTVRVRPGLPPEPVPDPIPPTVRRGPRMRIPGRDYLVYRGHLEDALHWIPTHDQTPHYWWPQDHAWAVAGDVDLPWSIVAGSADLMAQLATDPILEVLPIHVDAVIDPDPSWLNDAIAQAVDELLHHGAF